MQQEKHYKQVFEEDFSNYNVKIETLVIWCFQEINLKQNDMEKLKINVKKKQNS
jgi:hypothetical protein